MKTKFVGWEIPEFSWVKVQVLLGSVEMCKACFNESKEVWSDYPFDDLVLFAEALEHQVKTMLKTVELFTKALGQRVGKKILNLSGRAQNLGATLKVVD